MRAMFESPTIAAFSEVVMRTQGANSSDEDLLSLLAEIEQLSTTETRNRLAMEPSK